MVVGMLVREHLNGVRMVPHDIQVINENCFATMHSHFFSICVLISFRYTYSQTCVPSCGIGKFCKYGTCVDCYNKPSELASYISSGSDAPAEGFTPNIALVHCNGNPMNAISYRSSYLKIDMATNTMSLLTYLDPNTLNTPQYGLLDSDGENFYFFQNGAWSTWELFYRSSLATPNVKTLIGGSTTASSSAWADGGLLTGAQFEKPISMTWVDNFKSIIILEKQYKLIRKIDWVTNSVTMLYNEIGTYNIMREIAGAMYSNFFIYEYEWGFRMHSFAPGATNPTILTSSGNNKGYVDGIGNDIRIYDIDGLVVSPDNTCFYFSHRKLDTYGNGMIRRIVISTKVSSTMFESSDYVSIFALAMGKEANKIYALNNDYYNRKVVLLDIGTSTMTINREFSINDINGKVYYPYTMSVIGSHQLPWQSTCAWSCTAVSYSVQSSNCSFQCNAGYYKSANSCLACPTNTLSPFGSAAITQCTSNAGYFGNPGSSATPCIPGNYCPAGSTVMLPCAPGTFANSTQMSACLPCESLTYTENAGSSRCNPCNITRDVGVFRSKCGNASSGTLEWCVNSP